MDGTERESELGNRGSDCMKEGVLPEDNSKSPHPTDPGWPYFYFIFFFFVVSWEQVEGTLSRAQRLPDFPMPSLDLLGTLLTMVHSVNYSLINTIGEVASTR